MPLANSNREKNSHILARVRLLVLVCAYLYACACVCDLSDLLMTRRTAFKCASLTMPLANSNREKNSHIVVNAHSATDAFPDSEREESDASISKRVTVAGVRLSFAFTGVDDVSNTNLVLSWVLVSCLTCVTASVRVLRLHSLSS